MRDRILTLINLLLIGVCGACIYFLSTESYQKPVEIREAEQLLKAGNDTSTDTRYTNTAKPPINATPTAPPFNIETRIFVPVWTATPTPTPTPAPTPAPPDLNSVLDAWTITMIDGNNVEFTDRRDESSFVLTVGGPPKTTVDKDQRPIGVSLISADSNTNSVMLSSGDQTLKKGMAD